LPEGDLDGRRRRVRRGLLSGAALEDRAQACPDAASTIREDIGRYAAAGLTELFLEANFQPGGASLDRVLRHFEALAPRR